MTVRHILAETARAFEAAGVPDPALDAQLLLAEALSEPRLSLLIRQERVLTAEEEGRFRAMARRRLAREPLQYILGRAWFYGLPLRVGPGVLIPRADTESVCQMALDALDPKRACAVLDLCTGSGALALAIKRERPLCLVTATDLSPEALACARLNARENGLDVRVRGSLGKRPGALLRPGGLQSALYSRRGPSLPPGGGPKGARHGASGRKGRDGFLPPHPARPSGPPGSGRRALS